MNVDTIVRGGLVVADGTTTSLDVVIEGETIAAIVPDSSSHSARTEIDATGMYVLPGIIDAHNHPVYGDNMQTFSEQMAAGGVTTLIPFMGALAAWGQGHSLGTAIDGFIEEGEASSYLDFGIHATFSAEDDPRASVKAMQERGVGAAKMFMCFSRRGMYVDDAHIIDAMSALSASGTLAMIHAENETVVDFLESGFRASGQTSPEFYPPSRPNIAEAEAVFRALTFAEVTGCPTYLVHVSTQEAMDVIRWFRARNRTPIFVETCPHYLLLDETEMSRQGGHAKICPPLRRQGDINALWAALNAGEIDVLASDGAGWTRERKAVGGDNIFDVQSGMAGAQFMAPLVLSAAFESDRLPIGRLASVWCENPARIFGMYPQKGVLAAGSDADLVLVDPKAELQVGVSLQKGNTDFCPYEGWRTVGAPVLSMQRGTVVMRSGELEVGPGHGKYVRTPSHAAAQRSRPASAN